MKSIVRVLGLLILFGLLVAPGTALAAPTITVAPSSAAPGTSIVIAGSGFVPGAPLALLAEVAPGQRQPIDNVTAGADGSFRYTTTVPGDAAPGKVDIVVVSRPDSTELARAQLTVLSPPAGAPRLTIAPASGPPGTRFTLAGTGFPAGATLVYGIPGNRQLLFGQVQVGSDGSLAVGFDSTSIPAGRYEVIVTTAVGEPPLAGATFTVTAAAAPGLPNTGGGRLAPWSVSPGAPLAGLGLVALAALAIGIARRRVA